VRILILNVQAPYVRGGAEILADALVVKLRERGHDTEVVRIPFKWYPPENIPLHMLACLLMKPWSVDADLAIALKFPAYLIPFRNKRVWLLHQFRQAYELWGTPYQDLPNTPQGERIRDMVRRADDRYLPEASKIFTNSAIVAQRLLRYNGIRADGILYPPLLNPAAFTRGEFGNYFFYPSRVVSAKRQLLAVEAMKYVPSSMQLVLAGPAEDDAYVAELRHRIVDLGLQDRVRWLGWIRDEEKAHLMSGARAIIYVPFDEDSYGFVSLEAFHSAKPVVTMSDSGGTTELVTDGFNGYVVSPTAEALGHALTALGNGTSLARQLGQNAWDTLGSRRINWDTVLDGLLA
jgi:glycosyltransferase involved in cell wall biosynthesis